MTKEKRIPRKWEFMADECLKRGYQLSAALAHKIDQIIFEIYGDVHTEEWINDYKYNRAHLSQNNQWANCTPCIIHEYNNRGRYACDRCIFGRRAGICTEDVYEDTDDGLVEKPTESLSLYRQFGRAFDKGK